MSAPAHQEMWSSPSPIAAQADRTISRVHLLIIEIAGVLYAIDTASSNGVFDHDARERTSRLEPGTSLSLGDVATVEWSAR